MISIHIDLVPHGDENRRERIAEAKVWNTGEGTRERGSYRFRFWKKTERSAQEVGLAPVGEEEQTLFEGAVDGFPRKSYSVWELLKRVLNAVDAR